MGKYRIAIAICYVLLFIVCIIDIIFRFHGLLGLPFCLVQSCVVLFFARKLGIYKAKNQERKDKEYKPIVEDETKSHEEE